MTEHDNSSVNNDKKGHCNNSHSKCGCRKKRFIMYGIVIIAVFVIGMGFGHMCSHKRGMYGHMYPQITIERPMMGQPMGGSMVAPDGSPYVLVPASQLQALPAKTTK